MLQNAASFAGLNLFAPESAIKNIANFFPIPFAKSAVANNMSCKRPAAALTLDTIFANQKYRIAYSSEKQKVIAISSEEKSAIALSTRRSDKQSYDLAETETQTLPPRADTDPDNMRVDMSAQGDFSPASSWQIDVDDDLSIPMDLYEELLAAAEVAKNRGCHKIITLMNPLDGTPVERLVLSRTKKRSKPRPNFGNRKLLAACDAWKGDT